MQIVVSREVNELEVESERYESLESDEWHNREGPYFHDAWVLRKAEDGVKGTTRRKS